MHEATLMELFANPETIHSLSTGEKVIGSLVTTGMGMGFTFVILILLCLIIMLMTKILGTAPKKEKKAAVEPAAAPAPAAPAAAEPEDLMNDEELVAVITAAIAAAQGPGKQNNLYIRKIRRTSDDTPSWGRAGNKDSFSNRF